jgi:arsenate reductase-like glutaredoxin family protein
LRGLGKRAGGMHELVKPNNKKDAEGMSDAEVVQFLVENPNAVRRPIVDTGGVLTLGFAPKVRAQLDEALGKPG